jgi:c-di-GMP-binding flagellar brake protein YcgR
MGANKGDPGPPSSRSTASDRRKYRRIRAPLHYRSVDSTPPSHRGEALDISLGGVRIFSQKELPIGAIVMLEIFRPNGSPAAYRAQVMWVEPLADGAPARFELGLRFIEIDPEALAFLMQVIDPL